MLQTYAAYELTWVVAEGGVEAVAEQVARCVSDEARNHLCIYLVSKQG
jgi:hypothetical protein